jgi:hypothetical protein
MTTLALAMPVLGVIMPGAQVQQRSLLRVAVRPLYGVQLYAVI